MTSHGTTDARFTRAIKQRNLFATEIAIRALRFVGLADALDYLDLLADVKPAKLQQQPSAGMAV